MSLFMRMVCKDNEHDMQKIDDLKSKCTKCGMIEEIEEDDEFEVIQEPDLIYYCQRIKDGETCERNGQCIRFLFNEGRFDDCDALIMEDADEAEGDFALDMGDN